MAKFLPEIQHHQQTLFQFINKIGDEESRRVYAATIVNRLICCYFLQQYCLLDNDPHYLRNRLRQSAQHQSDRFFRDYLLPLFFDTLTKPVDQRNTGQTNHLGKLPFINSQMFVKHPFEESLLDQIDIADAPFFPLFEFFDQYQWQTDRISRRQFQPDWLSNTLECQFDQKQLGAYYTSYDVSHYICRNTIAPFILDAILIDRHSINGNGNGNGNGEELWLRLGQQPDRYIYPALKFGTQLLLPSEISNGINNPSLRDEWNSAATSEYALPTESWREIVARRQHYQTLLDRINNGACCSSNDLITANLDIEQFLIDLIEQSNDREFLYNCYQALSRISIVDPTCGSGEFLLTAFQLLTTLYRACLQRINELITAHSPENSINNSIDRSLQQLLKHIDGYANRDIFITEKIIQDNLYGVDIMPAAVEVCRWRLLLKLLSHYNQPIDQQLDQQQLLASLSQLTFNIRIGNALIGYIDRDQIKRELSLENNQELITALDRNLAGEYKVQLNQLINLDRWRATHQPFHWAIEFSEVIQRGGFDIVIGNPPYLEYHKIKDQYSLIDYQTLHCGNLSAYAIERAYKLLSKNGRCGLIAPLSFVATTRMRNLQKLIMTSRRNSWLSLFDVYPSKLFANAKQRLAIIINSGQTNNSQIYTTGYQRWRQAERQYLLDKISYRASTYLSDLSVFPKLGSIHSENILNKLLKYSRADYLDDDSVVSFYLHRIPYNYIKAVDFIPYFWNQTVGRKRSEDYKPYYLAAREFAQSVLAILNSNLFFWWWYTLFEGYHCGKHEISAFPLGLEQLSIEHHQQLNRLARDLMKDFIKYSSRKSCNYQRTGRVEYDQFYPRLSKPICDEIDRVLAQHYRLTDEELDFIINFDFKYRVYEKR